MNIAIFFKLYYYALPRNKLYDFHSVKITVFCLCISLILFNFIYVSILTSIKMCFQSMKLHYLHEVKLTKLRV